ncbi:glycoside hydrolase family 18 protein [Thelephora ganbajun]|uniref:Glycoside hydrolase family 18 protein n=1 Tax=Thelephora ganbajun TaxID=370292 RepID=A0ACB6ZVY7_THEGA|nr:glycoside hydrolase family 18 protein [Thelephora ganbajun]
MLTSLLLSVLTASLVTAAPSCELAQPSQPATPPVSVPNNGSTTTSFISAAWFPGWEAASFPFSSINWQKYSLITWSFAITTQDPAVLSLDASGPTYISDFVKEAQAHGTMASISVGGWTGSRYFSSAVTPQNRSTFVKAVLDLAAEYNLDGIDFDWEYPNKPGIGCNEVSGSDSENFLGFLQELRAQPAAKNLYLTAAVSTSPFAGPDGQPMTDVSKFAEVLDHIAVMNYDINGQWTTDTGVGPNAPLDDSCSTVQTGSATKAIKAWVTAGFPADKIVLGVPAYGHSYTVSPSNAVDGSGNLAAYPPFTKNPPTSSVDQCGNPEAKSDIMNFATLIGEGFLKDDGTPANGIKSRFDQCSQTPFVYDQTKQLMVSYDDPQSFAAKGKFIVQNNLLGFSMWEITGDHNDLLIDSLTTAAGVTSDC